MLFLGRLQDLAGGPERDCPRAASIAELVQGLGEPLASELRSTLVRVAVNGALAALYAPLGDGDEVAFLPPVSGG